MVTALTTIAPTHAIGEAQREAVSSWSDHGLRVVALNTPEEASTMTGYPCEFVTPTRTATGLYKAPYVMLSAFVDFMRSDTSEVYMLINSDITLSDPRGLFPGYVKKAETGMVIANRHDHDGEMTKARKYPYGFDVFIFHRKFIGVIHDTLFCLGQTWWDYWLPYKFIKEKVPVHLVKDAMFYHRRHPIQYNTEEWKRMTAHFQWIEGYRGGNNPQEVTSRVYKHIASHVR